MKQEGLSPIYLLLGSVILLAILLAPVPYYQGQVLCIPCPRTAICSPCGKPGWKLGDPLWKHIFDYFSAINQPTRYAINITTPTPTPSLLPEPTSPTDTNDWKIYTNTKYGFSFKCPKGWEVRDITNEGVATGAGSNGTYTLLKDWLSQNKYFGETKTVLTLLEPGSQKSAVVPKKITDMFIAGIRLEIKTATDEQLKWETEYLPSGDKLNSSSPKEGSIKKAEKLINGIKVLKITTQHVYYSSGLRDFSTAILNRNGYLYKLSNDSPGMGDGNSQFDQILSTFKFIQ